MSNETAIVIKDEDGNVHLRCPHCQRLDTIVEEDSAIRWNTPSTIELNEAGEIVYVHWSLGEVSDFDAEGYKCSQCLFPVELPAAKNYDEEWD